MKNFSKKGVRKMSLPTSDQVKTTVNLSGGTYWKFKAICLKYRTSVRDTLEKIILDHYDNIGGVKHA